MSKQVRKRKSPAAKDWATAWPGTKVVTVSRLRVEAVAEYVGWIDLMGAKGWMAGSIRHAAELVGLIHIAGKTAAAATEGAHAYPVIDGVYITSPDKAAFRKATHQTMRSLARTFESRDQIDRFLVRGGVAYGRVLHGESIARLHDELERDRSYVRCLAIGASIRQAYLAEGNAPPFGFYVDMTARSVASNNDSPYISAFDRWWRRDVPAENVISTRFGKLLDDHFSYLGRKHREIEYPIARLQEHRALAAEYFRLPAGERQ